MTKSEILKVANTCLKEDSHLLAWIERIPDRPEILQEVQEYINENLGRRFSTFVMNPKDPFFDELESLKTNLQAAVK